MNNNNYKSTIDNIQFSENLNEKTLEYLSSHISHPKEEVPRAGKNKRLYPGFLAVACALVMMITIPIFKSFSKFELPNSVGNVSVNYVDKAPSISLSSMLVWLSEEELFNKHNTDIFKGSIEDIKNIKIDFNDSTEYRAIAKIKIDKIYRGNGRIGETVSVLLPCPINTNMWVEDTEVVSSMKVGMTGIFMPVKYDDTSYREENGTKIYWKDIAEYGFMDGERYAFLNSDSGLLFSKHAYESIASATSLEEIEQYIIKMIE